MKKLHLAFVLILFSTLMGHAGADDIRLRLTGEELNLTLEELIEAESFAGSDDEGIVEYWTEITEGEITCGFDGNLSIDAAVHGQTIIDFFFFEVSITGNGRFIANLYPYFDEESRSIKVELGDVDLYEWQNSGWDLDFIVGLLMNYIPDQDLTGSLFEEDFPFVIEDVSFPGVEDTLVVNIDVAPEVPELLPDLSIYRLAISDNVFFEGDSVEIEAWIINETATAKYNFTLRIFDGDPDKNGDGLIDTPLHDGVFELCRPIQVFKLAPGCVRSYRMNAVLKSQDEMKVYAFVDGEGRISESREDNNDRFEPYQVILETVYISPHGDDFTGNGSLGNPWRSFQQAVSLATGLVVALPGIYEESEPVVLEPISELVHVRSSKGPLQTIITGMDGFEFALSFSGNNSDNLTFEGFCLMGMEGMHTIIDCGEHTPTLRELMIIDNNLSWQHPDGGTAVYGERGVQIENCTIAGNGPDMHGIWLKVCLQYEKPIIWNSIAVTGGTGYGLLVGYRLAHAPLNNYNDILNIDDPEYSYDVLLDPEEIGEFSLSENPGFRGKRNPWEWDKPIRFKLNEESSCCDTGDPEYDVPPGGGAVIDMGSCEFITTNPDRYVVKSAAMDGGS